MWKLLRNSILLAVLLVGVLKLVLWYEIQQGGARLVAQLAPYAQLQYASVGASFNGEVEFSDVSLAFGKERSREAWHASRVVLATPGATWLARRLLLGDDSPPTHLATTIKGLKAPSGALGALSSWLSPLSLVPFETRGCGVVSRFSVADYQRMGLNPGEQDQRFEYRYEPATPSLSLSAELRSPPFSTITLHSELPRFDPRLLTANAWRRLHVGELSLAYVDAGYFAKRNRFCAQQAGISAAQFVDQHMAAVQAWLATQGVEPGAEVSAAYRSLVSEGGRVSVLSLPSATESVGELLAENPDALMRRLNLTARRNDRPPVMVRLAFNATAAPDATPAATPGASAAAAPAPMPAASTAVAPPPAPPAPVVSTAKAPAAAAPAPPPAAVAVAPAAPPKQTRLPSAPDKPVAAVPKAVAAPPRATPAPPSTPPAPAAVAEELASAPGLGASSPPPAPGSTLSLVWKPTVDRLEKQPPPPKDYDVVEYGALNGLAGRFVRLMTTTGRSVEGRIISADSTAVAVRIQRPGGSAELHVPRNVISEIQVPHARNRADEG
jgi:hypothetical protein